MNQRDELIDSIMRHPWVPDMGGAIWPKGFCPTCSTVIDAGHNSAAYAGHIADALIAAGYAKAAHPADTETEWGVWYQSSLGDYGMAYNGHSVAAAIAAADPARTIVTRQVSEWKPVEK